MKYYTDLVWKRKVKKAMRTKEKSMEGLDELLYLEGAGNVCVKILVEGEYCVVIITARVRSTTGRYCFHRCLFM